MVDKDHLTIVLLTTLSVCVLTESWTSVHPSTSNYNDESGRLQLFVEQNGLWKELKNRQRVTFQYGFNVSFLCRYTNDKVQNVTFIWTSQNYTKNDSAFHLTSVQSSYHTERKLKIGSIFESKFNQSYSKISDSLLCVIENKTQVMAMLDYELKPRIIVKQKGTSLMCAVMSMVKPEYISFVYGNVTIDWNAYFRKSYVTNVYYHSVLLDYRGMYSCHARTKYGESSSSICVNPTSKKNGVCEVYLDYGQRCWNNSQCTSFMCRGHFCSRPDHGRQTCHEDDDCFEWATNSICSNNICQCKKHEQMIDREVARKCLKVVTLHHTCDANSKCSDENSDCKLGTCSCLRGYDPDGERCVLTKETTNSNIAMFLGVAACLFVLVIIICIMLIMKRTHMCNLGQVPEENRRSNDRRRRRRRSSFLRSFRQSLRRTPPPSYSRATKPPTYDEAIQMESFTIRRQSILPPAVISTTVQLPINITENTATCSDNNDEDFIVRAIEGPETIPNENSCEDRAEENDSAIEQPDNPEESSSSQEPEHCNHSEELGEEKQEQHESIHEESNTGSSVEIEQSEIGEPSDQHPESFQQQNKNS